jgi:tetratricopeptide (TPR) repeat protein
MTNAITETIDRGLGHYRDGKLDEAVRVLTEGITEYPQAAELYNALGVVLEGAGALNEAVAAYGKAVKIAPNYGGAWCNMAIAVMSGKKFARAVELSTKAIELEPDNAKAYYTRGFCLQRMNKHEQAIEDYHKSIELEPGFASAFNHLGSALLKCNRAEEALENFLKAVNIFDDYAEAWNNAAMACRKLGRLEQAEDCFARAVKLDSGFIEAHYNRANNYRDMGRSGDAIRCFQRAVELRSDFADAHYNMALAYFIDGQYRYGWRKYKWRTKARLGNNLYPHEQDLKVPRWTGQDLSGKTILLHYEQGIGDSINFIRFAEAVKRFGAAKVVVEDKGPLLRLFAGNFDFIDEFVEASMDCPAAVGVDGRADYHASYIDVAVVLEPELDEISGGAYIKSLEGEPAGWAERMAKKGGAVEGDDGKFNVGLVWGGNKNFERDHWRSCGLEVMGELLDVEGVDFYSLQKGGHARDLKRLGWQGRLINIAEEMKDFADTAAVIDNLDLVISVDTATGHLAGAMGKETWMLLYRYVDWRWGFDGQRTAWYDSMRLFRQGTLGKWDDVVAELKDALLKKIAEHQEG